MLNLVHVTPTNFHIVLFSCCNEKETSLIAFEKEKIPYSNIIIIPAGSLNIRSLTPQTPQGSFSRGKQFMIADYLKFETRLVLIRIKLNNPTDKQLATLYYMKMFLYLFRQQK